MSRIHLFLLGALSVLSIQAKPNIKAATCGYEGCPVTDPEALNVHIVPHSHDDVGWLKTYDQYYFQDVQNVISSVIVALKRNPERRFVQVETAFFKKWWEQQNDAIKQDVINLVNNGQFEIINGAWSMNDEAGVHYQYTIDQYTLGLRYLEDRLGPCSRPTVGWQIDPFGHSREQASINAQMGFDSMFFARLDYRDKDNRLNTKTADLLWRGSSNLGNTSDLFTSVLYNHYSAPPGFCFDHICNDAPIIPDDESPDYNYEARVNEFADFVRGQASKFATNHIIVVMGDDFRYQAALTSYINTDRLIKGFDLFPQTFEEKPIRVFYSTPSCYTKGVNEYVINNNLELQIKSDDFLPYGDGVASMIVGYFTSRPASKRYVHEANTVLQVAKQLGAVTQLPYDHVTINALKEIVGVMQHHDAITGTELMPVAQDYHRLITSGINDAIDTISPILSTLITGNAETLEFKSCLLANVSSCTQSQADQFTVVVYNPLSRSVSSPVSLPVDSENWQILDPNDATIDYQVDPPIRDFSYVDEGPISPYTLEFTAKNLPPFGFNVYRFQKTPSLAPPKPKAPIPTLSIGYLDTSFELDATTNLLKSVTMHDVTLDVKQDFLYYPSAGDSQTWKFSPRSNDAQQITTDPVKITPISGYNYQGVLQEFSSWAKQIIKVYNDDRSYIEFDWVIGPLDISGDNGKEVITRFTTNLQTNGEFYTDSNARELLKRVRNYRPDYTYTDEQPVAGNYYPITSKIVIRDEQQGLELAVLSDRSQGGGSIRDGEVELMVHRACHEDDEFGLNEREYGQGIIIRGKHYLISGPTVGNGFKSLAAIERDVAQRKFAAPWIFLSQQTAQLQNPTWSSLTTALPDNVQLLTMETWNENSLLIRLEHVFEQGEDDNLSQDATVDLTDLFAAFTITEMKEYTLAANIPLDELSRLSWPGSEKVLTSPTLSVENRLKRAAADLTITLAPMQIRTFIATVTYK